MIIFVIKLTIINDNIDKVKGFVLSNISQLELVKEKELIANKGIDKAFGARPLRRAIQTKIEDKLSELLLEDKIKDTCTVDFQNNEFLFKIG